VSGGLSGADDPYPLFIFGIRIGVNHEENGDRADHSDRVPSLFPVLESIGNDDVQRIVPDILRKVERDAVLGEIFPRFFGIPVKLQTTLYLRESMHRYVIRQAWRP
jgi:hypothetical protein